MHWQKACLESKSKQAVRINFTHRYIRELDGNAIAVNMTTNVIRDAISYEIEGFSDWKPLLSEVK